MQYLVVPIHKHPEHVQFTCDLINSEWKRSKTARLRSLQSSSDQLPTSLILLKQNKVIGHLKLSSIPSIADGCFVESVVIDTNERGKGYGTILMNEAEEYCKTNLPYINVIYLSTKGQEGFYSKLGYIECPPMSIYGSFKPINNVFMTRNTNESKVYITSNAPIAPPMPPDGLNSSITSKTFMTKYIRN